MRRFYLTLCYLKAIIAMITNIGAELMTWQTLQDYAAANGKSRNSALSLAFRGNFPKGTIKRTMVGGRCVLIQIAEGTPWPARKWSKRPKNAETEG